MSKDRKTIFITGAASGIGRAVAQYFGERGWFVGLADVDDAGLAQTASPMPSGSTITMRLDVREREAWADAMARFGEATGGRMHVLFNNAGIGRGGPFEELPQDVADLVVDINLKGVLNGIYAGLPLLKATPDSRIINTGSASGLYGAPGFAVYSATKFAVRALTEALDIEFEKHKVRVSSLMPWFVETPILDNTAQNSNETLRENLKARGYPIYPVSMVAERAWEAAHGTKTHYVIGGAAENLAMLSRFAPGMVRAHLKKMANKLRMQQRA